MPLHSAAASAARLGSCATQGKPAQDLFSSSSPVPRYGISRFSIALVEVASGYHSIGSWLYVCYWLCNEIYARLVVRNEISRVSMA
jgi:hypothetical protein